MAGKNVETDALQKAAKALETYIDDVSNNVKKMKDAALDCSDNMGNDVISQKAIRKLEECANDLTVSLNEAKELQGKILARKKQIENYGNSF
jgi:predicted RNase H-like nuclease (RuvC/YqgF family)